MSDDKSHDYRKRLSVELTSSLFKDDGALYQVWLIGIYVVEEFRLDHF